MYTILSSTVLSSLHLHLHTTRTTNTNASDNNYNLLRFFEFGRNDHRFCPFTVLEFGQIADRPDA